MTRTVTPLQAYLSQRGLFSRVAKKLGIDPSYVSRVANGHRSNDAIEKAIETELNKVRSIKPARSNRARNKQ
jgi:transcriptional regulator with XRE-family HTH domain